MKNSGSRDEEIAASLWERGGHVHVALPEPPPTGDEDIASPLWVGTGTF
jgi:hypothetical protein